jgi:hypothetical protein
MSSPIFKKPPEKSGGFFVFSTFWGRGKTRTRTRRTNLSPFFILKSTRLKATYGWNYTWKFEKESEYAKFSSIDYFFNNK